MTTYLLNQPASGDDLSISQPKLAANCNTLNTVYGLDHFTFDNTSLEQGFHNKVTTPAYQNPIGMASATPPTTSTYPIAYSFQPLTGVGGTPTTKLGLLQYSLPTPNDAVTNPSGNAVPTPLTFIQSPATGLSLNPAAITPIMDFTGLPGGMMLLYAADYAAPTTTESLVQFLVWSGTAFTSQARIVGNQNGINISIDITGKILSIRNDTAAAFTNSLRWTLQFLRTQ
jgi:hypothetical protein